MSLACLRSRKHPGHPKKRCGKNKPVLVMGPAMKILQGHGRWVGFVLRVMGSIWWELSSRKIT
jgi:hypothetical protein